MRIDRWNGNELRRYHHPSRAIVIVHADRKCTVIPACCRHVTVPIDRTEAARLIKEGKAK